MPLYRIDFKNHGGHVYSSHHLSCATDHEAIAAAHLNNVPGIGFGFDLWDGTRRVHSHPPIAGTGAGPQK